MDWNVFSALSSALATLAALGGLAVSALLFARQQRESAAAQIRADVRVFADAAGQVVRLLQDGSPLRSAAWQVTAEVRAALPQLAVAGDAQRLLRVDGAGELLAVAAWGSSHEGAVLRTAVAEMSAAGRRLSGDLDVLAECGEVLRGVADDVTSTLTTLLGPQAVEMLLGEDGEQELSFLLAGFASRLYANAELYFRLRYADSIEIVNMLVTLLGGSVAHWDAARLLAAARAEAPRAGTRTGAMKEILARRSGWFPAVAAGELVDRLELTITKEAAATRLREHT